MTIDPTPSDRPAPAGQARHPRHGPGHRRRHHDRRLFLRRRRRAERPPARQEPTASPLTTTPAAATEPSSVPNGPGIGHQHRSVTFRSRSPCRTAGTTPRAGRCSRATRLSGFSSRRSATPTPTRARRSLSTRRSVRPSTTSPRCGPTSRPSNATTPTDITVDGFARQAGRVHRPRLRQRSRLRLRRTSCCSKVSTPQVTATGSKARTRHHQLRILDVDGTRIVIVAIWYPDTSAQDRADIDAMLDSIQIG